MGRTNIVASDIMNKKRYSSKKASIRQVSGRKVIDR